MGCVVGFTLLILYPQGERSWYPLERRMEEPQSGLDAVVKRKFPSPARNRTAIIQPD
jgi:hypothetical protein